MTKQTASDESNESTIERVKSLYRKNKTTIHAIGAAAFVVTGAVLSTLAKQRYTPEDMKSDELAEPEEVEELEETPTHGRCADGWQSESIGKQGACSSHGGVAA
ncbi:hypothetical protein [Streptomyces sp. NBC_01320]|uniref:hypothetical protein n=1 Tax=Streptomyces sp. NBC_01320 TaxID=2903824 RepID=UPI002E160BA2|nr:hypothetical protein OG395_09030 [Streptomyces sp. NBC_01320]